MCNSCEKEWFKEKEYYLSNNQFHKSDGRFPVCKTCIKNSLDYNNLETVKSILQQLDRPFLIETWQNSILESNKTGKDLFGLYIKTIVLNYKTLLWSDSVFESIVNERESHQVKFKIDNDIITRWGSNYEEEDYIKLEDFYIKMKISNDINTPQEETYVKKLAIISLKMDKELEAGKYAQAKQLGDLFSKYMTDSKFRAADKSDADKTGGIRNFSTIYSEVEKDGHIPPWEVYRKQKGITQDLIDKTIMHIENFTLRLNKIERMTTPPEDTPKILED